MDKKHKGLVDSQDGDFILNESGTSVYINHEELETSGEKSTDENKAKTEDEKKQNENEE
jgi:hypothetical protein